MSGGMVFFTYALLAGALLVPHAGDSEKQLLALLVSVGEADLAGPQAVVPGDHAVLLAAQAARSRGHRARSSGRSHRTGRPGFLAPRLAGRAEPAVGAGHAPAQTVRAGTDGDFPGSSSPRPRSLAGGARVAAGAQPGGVIILPRATPAARRRGDRAARPAVKAARDLPHRRRPGPAHLAHQRRAGHAGGTDLCRPSTGVIAPASQPGPGPWPGGGPRPCPARRSAGLPGCSPALSRLRPGLRGGS